MNFAPGFNRRKKKLKMEVMDWELYSGWSGRWA